MKFLIDTNIVLELILEQQQALVAKELLSFHTTSRLFITDFSVHSIGILLFRHKLYNAFEEFLKDIIFSDYVRTIKLETYKLLTVKAVAKKYHLDFDDAYQYVAAETYDLIIVSFDSDFDRTDRGRQTPAEVLAKLT